MPVETAADIGAFFASDEFAEAAVYQAPNPGAAPLPCLVILDRGQGRSRFATGERQATGTDRHLWAMAGEGPVNPADTAPDAPQLLPDVRRDGLFTITAGGEVLRVAELPRLDEAGHLWSVELVAEG